MQKLNLDKKILVCIIVYAVLILDLLVVIPLQIGGTLSSGRAARLVRGRIAEYNRDSAARERFVQEKDSLSREIFSLQGKIMSRQDVSLFSAYVSGKAKEYGVDIIEVSAGNQDKYKSTAQGTYYYLPLKIDAESGFHNLAQFFNALERGGYYLNIEEMTVKAEAPYHKVRLVISTLLKE